MQRITMQFEEVHTHAKVYGRAETDILQMLQQLKQTQTNLHTVWEGRAMQAFDQQYDALVPQVQDFAELMKAIETQLVKVARAMEEMDTQLQQAILGG